MIKLYILYIAFGLYMLDHSLLFWGFPFEGGGALQSYIAAIASAVLFFIVPAVCLYRPRAAPVLGLICMALLSPFVLHWMLYRFTDEYFLWDTENVIMVIAVAWYLVTLVVTINYFMVRNHLTLAPYGKLLKRSLAFLPLLVFVGLVICLIS